MKKIILFDLDGTVTDSSVGIIKSVNYALDAFEIPGAERVDPKKFIGPPLHRSFMDFYGFSEEKAFSAMDKFREYYKRKGVYENTVYEGIPECLKALKEAGLTVCLATSKATVYAKEVVSSAGLMKYFDLIVGANLDGSMSDKSEIISDILHRYPDEPLSSFLMVGDRDYDIAGAKNLGIESVGVRYGFSEEGEFEKAGAEYIVNTPAELNELILSMK